jgi:hypothetical protein
MTQPVNGAKDLRDDDPYAMWDAAYVFGSLSESERHDFEAHLATCAHCREAVAELSGMPALLALIDADDVKALDDAEAAPPPLRPEVLDSLVQKVEWRRRRGRRLRAMTLAAAAAVLAVAVLAGIWPVLRGQGDQSGPMATEVTMSKLAETPINASVTLTGYGWGTRIDMVCTYGDYVSRGEATTQNLSMVVVGHNGIESQIATWIGINGATALPSGSTLLQKDQIQAVQLVDTDTNTVLLQSKL